MWLDLSTTVIGNESGTRTVVTSSFYAFSSDCVSAKPSEQEWIWSYLQPDRNGGVTIRYHIAVDYLSTNDSLLITYQQTRLTKALIEYLAVR